MKEAGKKGREEKTKVEEKKKRKGKKKNYQIFSIMDDDKQK